MEKYLKFVSINKANRTLSNFVLDFVTSIHLNLFAQTYELYRYKYTHTIYTLSEKQPKRK